MKIASWLFSHHPTDSFTAEALADRELARDHRSQAQNLYVSAAKIDPARALPVSKKCLQAGMPKAALDMLERAENLGCYTDPQQKRKLYHSLGLAHFGVSRLPFTLRRAWHRHQSQYYFDARFTVPRIPTAVESN